MVWLQWLRKWERGGDEANYFPDEEKGEVNHTVSLLHLVSYFYTTWNIFCQKKKCKKKSLDM